MMDPIYFFIPRKVYFQFVIDLISIRKELIFARIHLMRTIKHKEIHKIGIIELNLGISIDRLKQFLKKFIPSKIIKLRQIIIDGYNTDEKYKLGLYY